MRTDPAFPIDLVAPDGDCARVLPRGAHLLSWTARGAERLFLADPALAAPGSAVRGGVPVIFPQFAATGPLPRHGFARTAPWTFAGTTHGDGWVEGRLTLADDAATRAVWPHAFAAELRVRVGGGALAVTLGVTNAGDAPLAFTAALHTYLRVSDVARAAVEGLCGTTYRDSTAGGAERVDDAPAVHVDGEIDRIYLDVPGPLVVRDGDAAVRVSATGFPDVVVWNPGPERAAALPDLAPDDWRRMLCVEAAVVGRPVRLAPGERWEGAQIVEA